MVDMLGPWQAAAGAPCGVTTPYHRSPFVPKPFANPLGRVDMHLAILSRAPLSNALRTQLALLDEPRIIQVFNLKRALLTAEVEVEGLDQPLAVAVTHLSAFSFGDGTLAAQVAALDAWMAARPPGQPWILAGDMNLLPTGDDKSRLAVERDLYADTDSPIDPLLAKYTELLGNDRQLAPEHRTYLPFGADEPDRKIDYVFVGGPVEVLDARVMREHAAISDHLPVLARLRVGGAPPAPDPAPEAPSF
jgi:endonuclease/exonuclease/phosphatase family metal-dependent hydrolase